MDIPVSTTTIGNKNYYGFLINNKLVKGIIYNDFNHPLENECIAIIEVLKYCNRNLIFQIDIIHKTEELVDWLEAKEKDGLKHWFKLEFVNQLSNLTLLANGLGTKPLVNFQPKLTEDMKNSLDAKIKVKTPKF